LCGAPGETRTPGLLVRSQPLYPTELRARLAHYIRSRMGRQAIFDGIGPPLNIERRQAIYPFVLVEFDSDSPEPCRTAGTGSQNPRDNETELISFQSVVPTRVR